MTLTSKHHDDLDMQSATARHAEGTKQGPRQAYLLNERRFVCIRFVNALQEISILVSGPGFSSPKDKHPCCKSFPFSVRPLTVELVVMWSTLVGALMPGLACRHMHARGLHVLLGIRHQVVHRAHNAAATRRKGSLLVRWKSMIGILLWMLCTLLASAYDEK